LNSQGRPLRSEFLNLSSQRDYSLVQNKDD
jgi:hypothetical protein